MHLVASGTKILIKSGSTARSDSKQRVELFFGEYTLLFRLGLLVVPLCSFPSLFSLVPVPCCCQSCDSLVCYPLDESQTAKISSSPFSYILQAAMGQCSTLPDRPTPKKSRLSEGGRRESLDFNVIDVERPVVYSQAVKAPVEPPATMVMTPPVAPAPPQQREPSEDAMEVESREQAPPPLPEGAVRTRCYKLNLDSEYGLRQQHQPPSTIPLGPFSEPPPYLTYSSSEDSTDISPTKVAIRTAQIFRGITVGRDGTILTQNARATRSNRGNTKKRGEKSRQAAKIDKAKDMVEESMAKATAEDKNMVSLFIVGEYDDMRQLVRDGSQKLRDAEGMPDEALLSINRARPSPQQIKRQRSSVSPNLVLSQRTAALSEVPSVSSVPVTPKLKSHPRDTPRLHHCQPPPTPHDWSQAWSLWNCGGGLEGRMDVPVRDGGTTGRS